MKVRLLAASLAAMTLVSAAASAQDTTSERGKLSYAIGFNTGVELAELAARGEQVDVNTVIKAIQDAYAKKQPAVPVEELKTAVENMQKRQQAKLEAEFARLASENKAQSDAFLAQNRAKQGVQTLPGSTVQYRVIEAGSGAKPTQNSDVVLNYRGTLPDGTVFVDTNQAPEGQQAGPVTLKVSQIPLVGLREALLQMPTGARWEVVLPGDKAYGTDMRAGRMVNQAVVFDVKLVSVK
ncbi:FKBP-type peptidyl-prolyl cis-trans isomerase N-terminal domain-containing protein [Luteimonas wenzhouensis]|jgi:peptidylprolyl isomerase|uniref:Peptidyl-prolyl cis-trans isomerase n=1 Tax=Luteimonas wenzhouensis TaxID=2599615 RepID=A0A5C5U409_9GAMM|nr:FKBP-type peptidyl-prolyl cis-trans isomerase N-terminal domain-containing protein [Luteimonas wenzhouensis]NLW96679.1 FKBP-type peptidyl-prolyl cis-trans isomerase [Xanthomonadaceae bacterium]TWT20654.1 FKBP-type peptidyl-prolyl cis-trans isomerase [Luteimonas wenzhouensis]